MFRLSSLFGAIKRLTVSINTTADLWDAANEQLRQRLAVDVETEGPALLEHQPTGNGTARQTSKSRSR